MEQPPPPTDSNGLSTNPLLSCWHEKSATLLAPYVAGAVILVFFIRFVLPASRAHFAPDDMLNIYYYWSRGPLQLIKGLLLFPSTYYRPMGGVFYSLMYALFGLSPLPYHITINGLIIVNSYLAYRFASLISDSRLIGAMSALLTIYHSYLASLIYWPSFVYDVLCFTFFFLTLNYYISIRQKGALLTKLQILILLSRIRRNASPIFKRRQIYRYGLELCWMRAHRSLTVSNSNSVQPALFSSVYSDAAQIRRCS